MKLKNKVAVITGGSQGIGLGCAEVFARHGARVVMATRDPEAGRAAENQLAAAGHTVWFVPTVVTREEDLRALIEQPLMRSRKT